MSENQPIGIVVIGRNEGSRLVRCLKSIFDQAGSAAVVYVDSGSTDGSCQTAVSMGSEVVSLDTSIPFSAARARNAGLERLIGGRPLVQFVQFVDGDCEIQPSWLETAERCLLEHPDVVAVCGRRRERHPQVSLYNRFCDLEWNTPVGETTACGGDAMMRIKAVCDVGAYNPSVVAGEEPELCQRMRKAGGRILRIDAEMTIHDAAMTRFGQWWRRQIRSGYGALDVVSRFGVDDFRNEVRSARIWGPAWGLCVILAAVGGWTALTLAGIPHAPMGACLAVLLALGLWGVQVLRMTLYFVRRRGCPGADAVLFAGLTMIGKWAQVWGQCRYIWDRRSGRLAAMIDYKTSPVETAVS